MARRRGPARWPLVVLASAFVGLGAVALVGGRGDDSGSGRRSSTAPATTEDSRAVVATTTVPSRQVSGDPEPISVVRDPYTLTYRIEGFTNDGGAVIDLERRWARPPYASRVETTPDDGDEVSFLQISDFGALHTGREGEEPSILVAEPSAAPGDARVDIDMDAALEAGLVEWRHEERTILDRRCQVFRISAPMDIATLTPAKDEDWADLCIGDDGLVLQEEWVIGGDPFRRRTVIELDESPRIDDDRFATAEPDDSPRVGTLGELTADSRPAGVVHHELAAPPEGFQHRGRYGYSPPRAEADPTRPEAAKVAMIIDVYEDAEGRFVAIANGGTSDNSATVQIGADAMTVDLGPLGTGEIALGLRHNEVRVGFDRGRFLRVFGTLPAHDLVALTRSLTAVNDPDGQVVAKDPSP